MNKQPICWQWKREQKSIVTQMLLRGRLFDPPTKEREVMLLWRFSCSDHSEENCVLFDYCLLSSSSSSSRRYILVWKHDTHILVFLGVNQSAGVFSQESEHSQTHCWQPDGENELGSVLSHWTYLWSITFLKCLCGNDCSCWNMITNESCLSSRSQDKLNINN